MQRRTFNPPRRFSPRIALRAAQGMILLLALRTPGMRAAAEDASTNEPPAALDSGLMVPTNGQVEAAASTTFTNLNPANLTALLQRTNPPPAEPVLAPEPGQLPTPGVVTAVVPPPLDQARAFQLRLELARKQRRDKEDTGAAKTLVALLETNAPLELKRPVLFELALVEQDDNHLAQAAQVFAQYLQLFPEDTSAPEVLLRQGLIYRQMGVNSLAISKFYSVMSTALKLRLDNMDYYKKLVLQAQIEIANTYYLEDKYVEASDYFTRLLKNPPPELDQEQILYKLIRSLSCLTNHVETIARGRLSSKRTPIPRTCRKSGSCWRRP